MLRNNEKPDPAIDLKHEAMIWPSDPRTQIVVSSPKNSNFSPWNVGPPTDLLCGKAKSDSVSIILLLSSWLKEY